MISATGLPGVSDSAVAWGDYDGDGYLDILLSGTTGSQVITRIYRNQLDGTFYDIAAGLTPVSHGSVAWGAYGSGLRHLAIG